MSKMAAITGRNNIISTLVVSIINIRFVSGLPPFFTGALVLYWPPSSLLFSLVLEATNITTGKGNRIVGERG